MSPRNTNPAAVRDALFDLIRVLLAQHPPCGGVRLQNERGTTNTTEETFLIIPLEPETVQDLAQDARIHLLQTFSCEAQRSDVPQLA